MARTLLPGGACGWRRKAGLVTDMRDGRAWVGANCALHARRSAHVDPLAKTRLRWTNALHERFLAAVASLGGLDVATPKVSASSSSRP